MERKPERGPRRRLEGVHAAAAFARTYIKDHMMIVPAVIGYDRALNGSTRRERVSGIVAGTIFLAADVRANYVNRREERKRSEAHGEMIGTFWRGVQEELNNSDVERRTGLANIRSLIEPVTVNEFNSIWDTYRFIKEEDREKARMLLEAAREAVVGHPQAQKTAWPTDQDTYTIKTGDLRDLEFASRPSTKGEPTMYRLTLKDPVISGTILRTGIKVQTIEWQGDAVMACETHMIPNAGTSKKRALTIEEVSLLHESILSELPKKENK
jgi:hypothetical protein